MNSIRAKKIFAAITVLLLVFTLSVTAFAENGALQTELIPGGMAFGVKFFTEGAIVLGTTGVNTASGVVSPAKDAGLRAGDIIIRAGGSVFESASELTDIISGSGGKQIVIAYMRNGVEQTATVTPARDSENGCFRIGVFVRDSTAGIGTVTFIDPITLAFGGLGHGIYDSETSVLLPLLRGAVVDVEITDVVKSYPNSPGELRGNFGKVVAGSLYSNTEQGVFGAFNSLPKTERKPIPVASRAEVCEGDASVLTTLSDGGIKEYSVRIEQIYSSSGSTKNFLIKVTDNDLVAKTGGIVQGMSGSPIIQNGKLVGAVTHVLVNEPTLGYGIFIENMLNSAEKAAKKSSLECAA